MRRTNRWTTKVAALCVVAFVASGACGGDDAGVCAGTELSGSIPGEPEVEVSSAVAARSSDGASYTIYLADTDLDVGDVGIFGGPEPPGATVWSVALTTFGADPAELGPIEVGAVVDAGAPRGELTVTVGVVRGEESYGSTIGAEGSVTVTAVGDRLCGNIDYTDEEKSLAGTFEAPTRSR